jgi:tetratricopeptide (TPR) repeat protein
LSLEQVERFLAAAERAPKGSAAWIEATFGAGYLLVGDYTIRDLERGVLLLQRVVDAVEGYHPAYYYLGEALVMLDELDRAEALFTRALELDPSQEGIRQVLAHLPDDRKRRRRG